MNVEQCSQTVRHTRVKVEEGVRKVVFLNEARAEYVKTRVDKCLFDHETAADYLLVQDPFGSAIIELKGVNCDDGIKQIEATLPKLWRLGLCSGPTAGLVVCNKYPKFDTSLQRAMARFRKEAKVRLHMLYRNSECRFEELFTQTRISCKRLP